MGRLAARYGLSRSTLLHYDRIGLLRPSRRSAAGYRRYSSEDAARLARICRYRRVGLPLALVGELLDAPAEELTEALTARLEELDREIEEARAQQRSILAHLYADRRSRVLPVLTVERFTEILRQVGLSSTQRHRLHQIVERTSGEEHRALLAFLGAPDGVVRAIRRESAAGGTEPGGPAAARDDPDHGR